MIAALRESLDSPDGVARRTAVEACGRARVHELTAAVRTQLAATADPVQMKQLLSQLYGGRFANAPSNDVGSSIGQVDRDQSDPTSNPLPTKMPNDYLPFGWSGLAGLPR